MGIGENVTADYLIQLLEEDARHDIREIDISPEHEAQIQLSQVRIWYIETEKLIRVLANVLPSTMAQPINQLRYAGHHVLKAVTAEDQNAHYQVNVVEAFKHCKRAYYDSIDLYIYHMAEAHRDKLSFLPDHQEVRTLANELENFLESVNRSRLDTLARIEYYSEIRTNLISGLRLITKVNQAMSASGITAEIIHDRQQLAKENLLLKDQIEKKLAAGDRKFNFWMLVITLFIVFSTAVGLFFQSAGTQYFFDSHHSSNQPTTPANVLVCNAPDKTCSTNPPPISEPVLVPMKVD